jgi:hypothetical protein
MITSFIIHYLVWQVGNKRVICPSEYPFTGLLSEMFSVAFLDPSPFNINNRLGSASYETELEAIAAAKNRLRGLALLMRLSKGRSNQLACKIEKRG